MTYTRCWYHCHAATMRGGHYSVIEDAAILVRGERIAWIGRREALPPGAAEAVDLGGAWVTPGLIDCHTHLVFAGERTAEFELRLLEGASYAEIAAHGGGIASTVRATRAASEEQLLDSALCRARQLLRDGVTCLEVKSGYGLDLASERKLLWVARRLAERLPLTVRTTCLAAHAVPAEYAGRADDYIARVCEEMLPALAEEGLVDAVDAYCEHLAFSPEQVERLFRCASALRLPVKLHAEQLSAQGGTRLAARYRALSADHLEYADEADVAALAEAGTVAVLLPAAFYLLHERQLPPVGALRRHGVPIAVASDLNPGTAPVLSLRLMLAMACTSFGLTPEEALAGVTLHAARALGLVDSHGSLEVGKYADFVAWDIHRPAELAYWLGGELPRQVVFHGLEVTHG